MIANATIHGFVLRSSVFRYNRSHSI